MKSLLFISLFSFALIGSSQSLTVSDDSLKNYSSAPVDIYPADYMHRYNMVKKLIYKVYPYALLAADMLDEIDTNAAAIERRRKLNKFYKDSYKDLHDEFKYSFYELTTNEGIMLMKLVHRETQMTVYEIAEKYRGKKNAEIFNLMGKIFDQDIKIKFDPIGEDMIAEHVILDIQSGLIPFDNDVVTYDKIEYRVEQDKDKERKRKNKERLKANLEKSKANKKRLAEKEKADKKVEIK